MIAALKRFLPVWLKVRLRRLIKVCKYTYRKYRISKPIARGEPIKIIVGAAETYQKGWYSTNEEWLDITSARDWQTVFKGKHNITHVVAEHVFEHLTFEECQTALGHINRHMKKGGHIRIAVPDGNHPDAEYLLHVGINGIGDDASDHKQLLTVEVLSSLMNEAGFDTDHVEGYNASGRLIHKPYAAVDGFIYRSRANTSPDSRARWGFVDADTSLIVDGIKQ